MAGKVTTALTNIADSIANAITGQGTRRDAASYMQVQPVSLTHVEATHLYRGYWLARKIIDIPVQDMLKNGRTFIDMEQEDRERYERAWRDFDCDGIIAKAMKWSQLFGGSAIIPVNEQVDLDEPFNPASFAGNTGTRFIVLDAKELQPANGHSVIKKLSDPNYGRPSMFQYNGQRVDVSNLIVVRGEDSPHAELQSGSGLQVAPWWGQPKLLYAKEPIMHAHALYANITSMVVNNNIDVLKTPGLYESLAACGTDAGQGQYGTAVQGRAALFALYKGMFNVALIDDKESIERMKYDFTGLPQLLHEAVTAVSGLGDIPLTRLAGVSPGGLNSTGEADLDNYYNGITGKQHRELAPIYFGMDRIMTLIVFGEERELTYTINPPHTVSDVRRSEIQARDAETLTKLHDINLAPESSILRRMQRDHFPDIPDEWIEAVEEAEKGDPGDDNTPKSPTPDDDPDDDPDDPDDDPDEDD